MAVRAGLFGRYCNLFKNGRGAGLSYRTNFDSIEWHKRDAERSGMQIFHKLHWLPGPCYLPMSPWTVHTESWNNSRTRTSGDHLITIWSFLGFCNLSYRFITNFLLLASQWNKKLRKHPTQTFDDLPEHELSVLENRKAKLTGPRVLGPSFTMQLYCRIRRLPQVDWLCSVTKSAVNKREENWILILFV